MTTGTFISQLSGLIKKLESLVQSLQDSSFHPSKDQYQTLAALSLRLNAAGINLPIQIETLKNRRTEVSSKEGKKLIVQAESDRRNLITTTQLKNRGTFAKNIILFFEGQKDLVVDSEATKARKQVTRERCERIRSLSPAGLITWAEAFMATTWTANLMSKETFDYVFEHIEPDEPQVWPPDIYNILHGLAEEPLQECQKYHSFLKAAEDDKKKAQSTNQSSKRRRVSNGAPSEGELLCSVQTGELTTQIPAGQYASRMTQLPSLQQMALGAPSFNRDHTQDWGGTIDVEEQRHQQGVHPASLRDKQQKPGAADSLLPYKENREMKYMYTNAPASNISKVPEPFRTAVQNSQLWKSERSQGLETTGCWPSLFPKDNRQDVSFTIWCGNKDGYLLANFFETQPEISS